MKDFEEFKKEIELALFWEPEYPALGPYIGTRDKYGKSYIQISESIKIQFKPISAEETTKEAIKVIDQLLIEHRAEAWLNEQRLREVKKNLLAITQDKFWPAEPQEELTQPTDQNQF